MMIEREVHVNVSSPDLSMVWATRDDDYANGVNVRLVRSIESAQHHAKRLGIRLECIVVDWNSPRSGDVARLLIENGVSNAKVIRANGEAVKQFVELAQREFVEYAAKNIGLRRARGEQIACLNPDVTLSSRLFSSMLDRPYLENSFLRADRTDYSPLPVGFKATFYRRSEVLHVRHGADESSPISIKLPRFGVRRSGSRIMSGETRVRGLIVGPPMGIPHHFLRGMHTNAAGDFIVASRQSWLRAGGYDENRWLTVMNDAILVAKFSGLGLRQLILPGVRKLMHEQHPRDLSRGGAWDASMWPDFRDELITVSKGSTSALFREFGVPNAHLDEVQL